MTNDELMDKTRARESTFAALEFAASLELARLHRCAKHCGQGLRIVSHKVDRALRRSMMKQCRQSRVDLASPVGAADPPKNESAVLIFLNPNRGPAASIH